MKPKQNWNSSEYALQKITSVIELLQVRSKVLKELPDITVDCTDVVHQEFSTPEVNSEVTDFDIKEVCCRRAEFDTTVRPYKLVHGIKVFSIPSSFTIGQTEDWELGVRPDENWDLPMKKAGITESLIQKIGKYIKENPSRPWADE